MLVRRFAAYSIRCPSSKLPSKWVLQRRRMTSSSLGHQQQASNTSILGCVTTELDRLAPRIDINADQIKILEGPSDFYAILKEKIRKAKRRIYLSTLYIGKSEHELISCIREALQDNPNVKVSILTDALRGTRETPQPSCASLLLPLVVEFPEQVEVRMYHTPNLTGLRKKIVPKRINEGWGLQHMKLYGVDDEIILSGANLSNDYFTNRQDRYHIFSSRRVSDYFARIHHTMCSVSFLLQSDNSWTSYTLKWPSTNAAPSPLADPAGYNAATTKLFIPLSSPAPSSSPPASFSGNTTIYPLLTLPRSLNTELPVLRSLLSSPLPIGSSYLFTAGYFNPHPLITTSLLTCSASSSKPQNGHQYISGTVLTAHPHANGFYGSKGVSGMLPAAYTLLSRRFLRAVAKTAPGRVELREWRRGMVGEPGGWTYHAKGLWLTLPHSPPSTNTTTTSTASSSTSLSTSDPTTPSSPAGPSITVIGSSNYTTRSYSLDAEVGAVVVTSDEGLMRRLKREEEGLLAYSRTVVDKDLRGGERRVGLGVRVAMWIVRVVGGAL